MSCKSCRTPSGEAEHDSVDHADGDFFYWHPVTEKLQMCIRLLGITYNIQYCILFLEPQKHDAIVKEKVDFPKYSNGQ